MWQIQCVSFLLQSCHRFSLHWASLTDPADILRVYVALKNPSLNKKKKPQPTKTQEKNKNQPSLI